MLSVLLFEGHKTVSEYTLSLLEETTEEIPKS